MPRRPRLRLAGIPFHVIQRGHNRSACFFSERDRERYLHELSLQARHHRVAIHAYVLMTNHVHLLMTPETEDGIGQVMKVVGQRYVQYVNRTYDRLGTLWGGRFRSCLVDSESYLLRCHQYIEMNPVRAGMVDRPGAFRWSSHGFNAEGKPDELLATHSAVEALGRTSEERRQAYRDLFLQELDPTFLADIRDKTNAGDAFGSEAFQNALARTLGRTVTRQRRGPKRRSGNGEN